MQLVRSGPCLSHRRRTPTRARPRSPRLTADAPLTPSKSQRKRDAHALQALGIQLVALSAAQLARLDLPEALHEAVVAAQRMRAHGARTRQMQYIGKLMRQLEPTVLSRIRAALAPGGRATHQPSIRQAQGRQRGTRSHAIPRAERPMDRACCPTTGGHVASSSPQRNR